MPRNLLLLTLLLSAPACDDPGAAGDLGAPDMAAILDAAATGEDAASPADGGGLSTACPVVGFSACGGALDGNWEMVSFCPEDAAAAAALFEHPSDDLPACQDRAKNPVVADWRRKGTVAFAGGKMTVAITGEVAVRYGYSDECLGAVVRGVGSPAQACAEVGKMGKLTCAYDATAHQCRCTATVPAPPTEGEIPYTLSGSTITTGDGDAAFCTDGETLILDWAPHPVSWRYWILRRS